MINAFIIFHKTAFSAGKSVDKSDKSLFFQSILYVKSSEIILFDISPKVTQNKVDKLKNEFV